MCKYNVLYDMSGGGRILKIEKLPPEKQTAEQKMKRNGVHKIVNRAYYMPNSRSTAHILIETNDESRVELLVYKCITELLVREWG